MRGDHRLDRGGEPIGRFDLNRDIRDLMALQSDNILQIKLNYWLNL